MKPRIETLLNWDFTRYNTDKGLPTNLLVLREASGPPLVYLEKVSVHSLNDSTEGRVHVTLNRHFGSNHEIEVAVGKLYHTLYQKRIISGSMGGGPDGFTVEFELSRRQNSFEQVAVGCIIGILMELGIERSKIFYPDVTYKKYMWIPKAKAPLTDKSFWGWIEYGKWIGSQCRLYDHIQDKPLPEFRFPSNF